ncbi:MAG: DUF2384 domain-containing protein [Flavobacteriales bacterium]|nr:DUF2384 domain-containing protein [Flavobacteriales bacterium]
MAKQKKPSPSIAAEPQAQYLRLAPASMRNNGPRPIADWVKEGSRPLSMQRFRSIARKIPLDLERWGVVLHIPVVQWKQRIIKRQPLNPLEADRVLLVEELYRRGEEVFGSMENFHGWMEDEHLLLGKPPMDLLVSSKGIEQVLDELIAIEHGLPV